MAEKKGDPPGSDYFKVKNDWFDALIGIEKLPWRECRCLLYIIRRTYGWQKKSMEIPINDFVVVTGIGKTHISAALKSLKFKKLIRVTKNDNCKYLTYSFNKYFNQWKSNLVTENGNSHLVTENGNKKLPKTVTKNTENGNSLPITPIIVKDNIKTIKNNHNAKKHFALFWDQYPIKKGKMKTYEKWLLLIKNKTLPSIETILKAIKDQTEERETLLQIPNKFIPEWKYPTTWLNQGCWSDECYIPETKPQKTELEKWREKQSQKR